MSRWDTTEDENVLPLSRVRGGGQGVGGHFRGSLRRISQTSPSSVGDPFGKPFQGGNIGCADIRAGASAALASSLRSA